MGITEQAMNETLVARPERSGGWQPIETAPREEEVLVGWWVSTKTRNHFEITKSCLCFEVGYASIDGADYHGWYWCDDWGAPEYPEFWHPLPLWINEEDGRGRAMKYTFWWWMGLFQCRDHGYGLWRNVWCWIRGHHGDVWWYDASGFEPDMRCKDCGEDLR